MKQAHTIRVKYRINNINNNNKNTNNILEPFHHLLITLMMKNKISVWREEKKSEISKYCIPSWMFDLDVMKLLYLVFSFTFVLLQFVREHHYEYEEHFGQIKVDYDS